MIHKGAENFRVAKYRFELKALTQIELPRYKGSTFRGAFGGILRRICCSNRDVQDCRDCLLKVTCPYAYIFETRQPPEEIRIKRLRDMPRPFVLEPPLGPRDTLDKDEVFSFGLILIGRAIDLLPYFLVTFKELGVVGIGRKSPERGIGSYPTHREPDNTGMRKGSGKSLPTQDRAPLAPDHSPLAQARSSGWPRSRDAGISSGRGKFLLHSVYALSQDGQESLVYSHEDEMVRNLDRSFTLADLSDTTPVTRCTIEFLTPTRIRSEGSLGSGVGFHSFFSRLLERIQALSLFHCGGPLDVDHLALKQKARSIQAEKSFLSFRDWTRYSSRQKTKMQLGGYKGQIIYSGDLAPFLPFLRMGQYVHVGKNTTFGLGQYRISYE
ncbi:MAG TPA: CRISPR system precrRNA processing endoribonuclease RAMP protein Cas6 [Candidatus Latescibacteria bacterium]|nr:CRISPR system precrRNA processing endoribonuclease RAMP protein Cas6 [Candidatus Latescibacterota bacterium]